jgi:hypothetical protein
MLQMQVYQNYSSLLVNQFSVYFGGGLYRAILRKPNDSSVPQVTMDTFSNKPKAILIVLNLAVGLILIFVAFVNVQNMRELSASAERVYSGRSSSTSESTLLAEIAMKGVANSKIPIGLECVAGGLLLMNGGWLILKAKDR